MPQLAEVASPRLELHESGTCNPRARESLPASATARAWSTAANSARGGCNASAAEGAREVRTDEARSTWRPRGKRRVPRTRGRMHLA
jgi:hypothetical protein